MEQEVGNNVARLQNTGSECMNFHLMLRARCFWELTLHSCHTLGF